MQEDAALREQELVGMELASYGWFSKCFAGQTDTLRPHIMIRGLTHLFPDFGRCNSQDRVSEVVGSRICDDIESAFHSRLANICMQPESCVIDSVGEPLACDVQEALRKIVVVLWDRVRIRPPCP
jgi:hypothetical protein